MHHKAADLRKLLFWPFIGIPIVWLTGYLADDASSLFAKKSYHVSEDGSQVEFFVSASGPVKGSVSMEGTQSPLLGRFEVKEERLIFRPSLPLALGRNYHAVWEDAKGQKGSFSFFLKPPSEVMPKVEMSPRTVFPANALKLYLHFSQPMEQGVFLERLRLLNTNGKEVIGPFRETELWSPDGKRLTVWFHPGRQKSGVNLNQEEGPVLRENTKHTLVVAGSWRSTSGIPLGADVRFDFQVGPADHTMPNLDRWQITLPKSGTREPLLIHFDEPLDPAMLTSALQLWHEDKPWPLRVSVDQTGKICKGLTNTTWPSGNYQLQADPLLEDLAGNNFIHLFEVELFNTAPKHQMVESMTFHLH